MASATVIAAVIEVVLKVIGRSSEVNRVCTSFGQAAVRPQAVGRPWWSQSMRPVRPKSECIDLVYFYFLLYPSVHPFFVTWLFVMYFSVNCSHLASIISLCLPCRWGKAWTWLSYWALNSVLNSPMGVICGIIKDTCPNVPPKNCVIINAFIWVKAFQV